MAERAAPAEALVIQSADGPIFVQAFPADPHLVRDIGRAAAALNVSNLGEAEAWRAVSDALRAWYPMLAVRPREDLAGLSPNDRVWYVLRDGRVGRHRERIDRMHAALSDARETEAQAEAAIQHAREALAVAGSPRAGSPRTATRRNFGDGSDDNADD